MLKNIFKFEFHNYWRNIDKNILFGFFILFFLGLFFSFSSTSSLAGETLIPKTPKPHRSELRIIMLCSESLDLIKTSVVLLKQLGANSNLKKR